MIGAGAAWQTLTKKIREQQKELIANLVAGRFGSDIGQARELVGGLAQLEWVLGQAADILGEPNRPLLQPVDPEDEY